VSLRRPFTSTGAHCSVGMWFLTETWRLRNEKPAADALDDVRGRAGEEIRLGQREIYVYYPSGMGQSKLQIPARVNPTRRRVEVKNLLAETEFAMKRRYPLATSREIACASDAIRLCLGSPASCPAVQVCRMHSPAHNRPRVDAPLLQ
jgi:hypothetical protein